MISIFESGVKGLADSAFSGVKGAVYRIVGVDFRTEPGKIKVQQKLTKVSASVVDVLCKSKAALSDGKKLWFGDNKIFLDDAGIFSKKLTLTMLDRDLMFSTPSVATLGNPSSVVRLNEDGRKLYVLNQSLAKFYQYSLSEPYDPSTATLATTKTLDAVSFWIRKDAIFALSYDSVVLYRIQDGDISSMVQVANWDISSKVTDAQDLAFKDDGSGLFILGRDGTVHEFSLSEAFGGEYPVFRMLVVGGGASGGATASFGTTSGRWKRGGCGGAGNAAEFFNESLTPSNTYSITVGQGASTTAAGDNHGTNGGDTSAFGKTAKGGGYGGAMISDVLGEETAVNRGGDGGSSGGGSRESLEDDNSQDQAWGNAGAVVGGSTEIAGGTVGDSGGNTSNGGGVALESDITGTLETYSPAQTARTTFGNGADATSVGQGGQGGRSGESGGSGSMTGGKGAAGVVALRFKTALVSYSQTGGTVNTVDDETVITWTTSGTFSYTADVATPLFVDTFSFPEAKGFAIEADRMCLVGDDKVRQYTFTDYDLESAELHDNSLYTGDFQNTASARSLFLTDKYGYLGIETGTDTDSPSVMRYEFVDGGSTDILSAEVFSPNVETLAKSDTLFDSVGVTEHIGSGTTSIFPDSGETSLSNIAGDDDMFVDSSVFTNTPAYARAWDTGHHTSTVRGRLTSKAGDNITIDIQDYPDIGQNGIALDAVAEDSLILSDAIAVTSGYDGRDTATQPFVLPHDTEMDAVEVKFREGMGLNGGYSLTLEVKDDAGTVMATSTVAIAEGDIGYSETMVRFTFTAFTVRAGIKYSVNVSVNDLASLNWNRQQNRYVVTPVRSRSVSAINAITAGDFEVELQMRLLNTSVSEAESETNPEERVYFTTEKMLFYIKAADVVGDWSGKIVSVGAFKNGNAAYHPLARQNLSLFIGDGKVIAEVDVSGVFTRETNLNVEGSEIITALRPFDTDLLIGTMIANYGRVLRWDTQSDSWSAQDEVFEKGGVTAFLPDDNYVYVFAGEKGTMYFYNGSENEVSQRIPGANRGKVRVNHNAIGFLNNIPLFGLTNVSGDPIPQGIYGFGKYSPGYTVAMSLDFPIPSDVFTGVSIGAIHVDGDDMWASYQDSSDVGIAKLDYTAKYAGAYIETMQLTAADVRHQLKTLADVLVPFFSLPESAGITLGVKKVYEENYATMDVRTDSMRKLVSLKTPSVKDMANPQLRIGLTVSENQGPEIEDVLFDIAPIGKK